MYNNIKTIFSEMLSEVSDNVLDNENNLNNTGQDIKLYFEVIFSMALYGYLLITLLIRRCRLAHAAYHQIEKYPNTLIIRIIVISMMILVYIISIALNFLPSGTPEIPISKQYVALLLLVPVFVLGYQIRMIIYDYHHRLRLAWYIHKLFWMISLISYLTLIALDISFHCDSEVILTPVVVTLTTIKAIISFAMIWIHIYYPQDWEKFEENEELTAKFIKSPTTSMNITLFDEKNSQVLSHKLESLRK